MVAFDGEIKVKSNFVGEWLPTHEGGEHVKDFEFSGVLLGYELEAMNKDDTVRDIVYFADESGKVWKTTIPQIYGLVKYYIKSGSLKYGDVVTIKYLGKEKIKDARGVRFRNNYDLKFYSQDANKKYVKAVFDKLSDIPGETKKRWKLAFEQLTTVEDSDEVPF